MALDSSATLPADPLDPALVPDHHQPLAHALEADASPDSSVFRERERNQLRVVAHGLAPQLVLDQPLSVPAAPPTLRHCLAPDAPLLAISVVRACLNEASTNALFSSATSLDASPEETTRLLNDVDSFQTTVLGLLDEVERRYAAEAHRRAGPSGLKREFPRDDDDEADVKPATGAKKYMLHRGGANGGDLFTSAAFLSDRDLEAVSMLQDADLVAVHPAPPPTTTTTPAAAVLAAPVPTLGALHPPFPPAHVPLPVALRWNLAPGQAAAVAPFLPPLVAPPSVRAAANTAAMTRETRMLDYGVWTSAFAPSYDSQGSTDGGYYRAATRQVGRDAVKRWERGLVATEPLARIPLAPGRRDDDDPGRQLAAGFDLSERERATLGELEVELSTFLQFAHRAASDERHVWAVLERNLELIQRLGAAQVARTRKSAKKEERRRRAGRVGGGNAKKKDPAATGDGVAPEDGTAQGEERRDLADGVEKQDADALLESFTSLLSSFYQSSRLPSLDPEASRTPPSLLPAPSLVRSLAPLIVGELTREPSYTGALEALEGPGGQGWEKAVKEGGTGAVKQE
ncbi:hypothetical protein JCM11491_002110 [Sporobolomyces phaffii]